MLKLKRGLQLLVVAGLVSVNWQLAAREDLCDDMGPQWCCENIACPINEDLCMLEGGENTTCYWTGSYCEPGVCVY